MGGKWSDSRRHEGNRGRWMGTTPCAGGGRWGSRGRPPRRLGPVRAFGKAADVAREYEDWGWFVCGGVGGGTLRRSSAARRPPRWLFGMVEIESVPMADEYQMGNGSWWDTNPSRNRLDGGATTAASITTTLASFGWPTDLVDMKSRSASGVLHGGDQSSTGASDGVLAHQVVGLALSSETMDWNQSLLGEKAESSFRSLVEEDMMSTNTSKFQHDSASNSQQRWTQKLFSGPDDFKRINRGFSLDQPHFSQASSNDSTITSQNLSTSFQAMNSAPASYVGLLLSENQPVINYPYPSSGGYGANAFLGSNSHLHFSTNVNTPFWNAPAPAPPAAAMADARSSFFPADQVPCFDENLPENTSEVRDLMSKTTKKNSADQIATNKRTRSETPSPLPAFKVRKEKMGDRITALQQLVSPFGKTDTASVLSEAIEYIKFLHEQVRALSDPYMKNGAPIQHQQKYDKSRLDLEGHRQDLKSRGLCLVPISSTFPVTHETTVDFWTPTFGGSFR
ncbi:transcription factor bhlh123 [Phtheirospermum japonicum]|uniref:Transcription factor bhlh123 n=1 Tax=Phtheirospermum japonicum TaxID=374723 RepID=A0A830BR60_9LAMI|nr:transcription factor bhlh123 [Phtheirospermum japonicum]